MRYLKKKTIHLVLKVLIVTALAAAAPLPFAPAAGADEWGHHHGEYRDMRFHHDRFYPARGGFVVVLPPGYRTFGYGGVDYFFAGGVWYRGARGRFVVVAPPFGVVVPFLPPYYTTVWVAGVPYYYANEVYYMQAPGGYVVVSPPQAAPSQTPPPTEQLYVYPRNGQNEQQQANDRYECHRWATSQTGFDPTMPQAGITRDDFSRKNADYRRAISACLDGRGYTVK